MGKTKGQKVIKREEKRRLKEKQRKVEEANKMLIPVPKATTESTGLLSFDPAGALRFKSNRFVKLYKVLKWNEEQSDFPRLDSKVRITKMIDCNKAIITLTIIDEIYDEVRAEFEEDEKKLKAHADLEPITVDGVMNEIALLGKEQPSFNYASMVRGKKNWKTECMPEIKGKETSFLIKESYGECIFALLFPERIGNELIKSLKETGCKAYVVMDLKTFSEEEKMDYCRALEKRYNQRTETGSMEDIMNASIQILFFCDSDDARQIVEKMLLTIASKEGFVMAPVIGEQKESAESILSFGLMEKSFMRNVAIKTIAEIGMEGGNDGSD